MQEGSDLSSGDLADRDLDHQIGPQRLASTSEALILSFLLPDFNFRAFAAYDILRSWGVPLGSRIMKAGCIQETPETKSATGSQIPTTG
jgi:hypothetical protein